MASVSYGLAKEIADAIGEELKKLSPLTSAPPDDDWLDRTRNVFHEPANHYPHEDKFDPDLVGGKAE